MQKTPPIVQRTATVLRAIARDVVVEDIETPKIRDVITAMKAALDLESDGAALAAPQIGESLRIFVISEKLFGDHEESEYRSKDPHFVFINPTIIKKSRKKELMDEGCLSVRGKYGTVRRHTQAVVRAYDENGKRFERGASGLLAQVFQHECDHLDGTLFIDKAEELWNADKPTPDHS